MLYFVRNLMLCRIDIAARNANLQHDIKNSHFRIRIPGASTSFFFALFPRPDRPRHPIKCSDYFISYITPAMECGALSHETSRIQRLDETLLASFFHLLFCRVCVIRTFVIRIFNKGRERRRGGELRVLCKHVLTPRPRTSNGIANNC